ncbi:MAG: glycosyltransferase family 2 protein, partial [Candidatus Saccharimonadales bacterium]
MSKTNTPLVSVIIVNWNGEEWLRRCLDGLLTQTYSAVEIIFVDNNSSDNSVALVEKAYPSLKIIRNDKNLGFSGGNNSALPVAKGEYLLLLNTDTVVANDYIQSFVDGFDKLPAATACIQSKIVLESNTNKIDSAGSFWTNTSFLYHYGNGKDASLSNYNKSFKVFSNKGASLLIKRSAVDKIGLFDEDFWCYYEETDFCNRLWLAGYECWYYPGAIIIHAGGSSSLMFKNDYIQFHNFKNKLLSFLKNYQASTLVTVLPTY